MWNWKNNLANEVEYSIYVASFVKACSRMGIKPSYRLCMEWLSSLTVNGEKLSEEDKSGICNMLDNGKLELQEHCEKFLEPIVYDEDEYD
jgi:hypothetical protein